MLIYQTYSPSEATHAFDELYVRFSQKVFNFLNKKIKNSADSEDLLQRVFIKIHESKHLYKSQFKFEQWVFVIARTQALDYFRAASRYSNRLKQYEPEEASNFDTDTSLLNGLNASDLEFLEMKYIDDLSYGEISKILNKSEGSLRKSLSRMVGRLRKGESL